MSLVPCCLYVVIGNMDIITVFAILLCGMVKVTILMFASLVFQIVFFGQIIFPFIVLVYCTVRIVKRLKRKTVGDKTKLRRAVSVVLYVVFIFSFCFLPCAIARAVLLTVRCMENQSAENVVVQIYDSLIVLSYIDCLLDPMVYCFCNTGFKNAYISNFCPLSLQEKLLKMDFGLGLTTTTTPPTILGGGLLLYQ